MERVEKRGGNSGGGYGAGRSGLRSFWEMVYFEGSRYLREANGMRWGRMGWDRIDKRECMQKNGRLVENGFLVLETFYFYESFRSKTSGQVTPRHTSTAASLANFLRVTSNFDNRIFA